MANEKFTDLPVVANSTMDDIIGAVQAGLSTQQTLQQVYNLVLANTILSYPGNPNTHLAGKTYQLCFDTTNTKMYVCNFQGDSSSSVWILISAGSGGLITPAEGGTGVSNPAEFSIPISQGSSPFDFVNLDNGQLLIGSTSSSPVVSNISAGTNISVVNAPGAITISSPDRIISPTFGGTGVANPTNNGIAISNGSSNFSFTTLNNGQVLIGSTGVSPSASTITAGTNINITNSPASITIDTTGVLTSVNNLSDVDDAASSMLNLFTSIIVDTTTALTPSAFGVEVICRTTGGGSDYTITLPNPIGFSNKFIDIVCQMTDTFILTIDPHISETISGQSSLLLGSGDSIRLISDGTNWRVTNEWLQPVNFITALSTNLTVPSATPTAVPFDIVPRNIGGYFDSGSSTFTPLLPGLYELYIYAIYVPYTVVTPPIQIHTIVMNSVTELSVARTTVPAGTASESGQCIKFEIYQSSSNIFNVTTYQSDASSQQLNSTYCYFGGRRLSLF